MIQRKELTIYFESKDCEVCELKGYHTFIIISPMGHQLILPLKRKYFSSFLYFHFRLNADFFPTPFNWKTEYHQMMLHIEINRIIKKSIN